LSETARQAILRAGSDAVVSAVSVWEASIKRTAGRLPGPELLGATRAAGFPVLSIHGDHARLARKLPLHHRDPFDRMLVAQATVEQLTIVTRDRDIPRYGVPVVW